MRFFIACFANHVTGGTELLHQLSWHLRNRGIENYMLYTNTTAGCSPTADVFEKYEVSPVTYFVDDESSVLVLPEIMLDMADICRRGTIIIWWLSVDNYIAHYKSRIYKQSRFDVFGLKEKENVIHFVQSRYAREFVEKQLGVEKAPYLKDYINDEIIQVALQYRKQMAKENILLYNPKKGAENLENIQSRCRTDIKWIPLIGLRPDEIAMLMCRAKVYIDFGTHPGKDRIPREAAVCGCCIITNRQGSAVYAEDVGIPEKYKISDMRDYDNVLNTIYDLVDNYSERAAEYETYVTSILGEKEEFHKEVDNMLEIVGEKCTGIMPHSKGNKYDELLESMQEMISKINSNYEKTKELYSNGEVNSAVGELLKVEGSLSMLREAGYMVINDMLLEE